MSKKICCIEGCNNKVKAKNLCSTHYTQYWRKQNQMRSTWLNLKNNSKRRNKVFELSFEEFIDFCKETDYMMGKGITKHSYHIDRIEEHLGYTRNNIQKLENTENVKKYVKGVLGW